MNSLRAATRLTKQYPRHVRLRYTEPPGELAASSTIGVQPPGFGNLFRRKLGPYAPFLYGIGHVFKMSSEKQMRRPNAKRDIACMTKTKGSVEFTEMNEPRYFGRVPGFAFEDDMPVLVIGSRSVLCSSPQPAGIGIVDSCDFLPESFSDRSCVSICRSLISMGGDNAIASTAANLPPLMRPVFKGDSARRASDRLFRHDVGTPISNVVKSGSRDINSRAVSNYTARIQ